MSRNDVMDKFGKHDEIIRDDADGDDAGFAISGTDNCALEITLMSDSVKRKIRITTSLWMLPWVQRLRKTLTDLASLTYQ